MSRQLSARIAVATAIGLLIPAAFAVILTDADRTPHRSASVGVDSAPSYLAADRNAVGELRASKPSATSEPAPAPAPAKVAPKPKKTVLVHTSRRAPASKKQTTTKLTAPATFVPGPTKWSALNAAIARIPSYHAGGARWIVKDTGWWGTADWYADTIYISPSVPDSKLYDVAVHEWSHLLSVRAYDDVHAAAVAMRAFFGGSNGPEAAADCMAKLQGANYLHYTQCNNATWIAGAKLLLAGKRL